MIFSSLGCLIDVLASNEEIKLITKNPFLQRYIPDIRFEDCSIVQNQLNISKVIIQKSIVNSIVYNNNSWIYSYKECFVSEDIISLLDFHFEYLRQKNDMSVTLHASCATINKKTYIFWGGASGMGKTRLALALEKRGGKMIFDEKVVFSLEKGSIVSGVRSIYNNKDYYKKIYGKDEFINISIGDIYNPPIFIYGFVRDGSLFEFNKWDNKRFDWHLYEESSRKIRGVSKRLFNFSVPLQSLDEESISLKRAILIKKFVEKQKCYYISGDEQDCFNFLIKL